MVAPAVKSIHVVSVLFVLEPNQQYVEVTSEVYTAREADEWGDSTSSNTPEGIVNTVGTGVTDITVQKDFKRFLYQIQLALFLQMLIR